MRDYEAVFNESYARVLGSGHDEFDFFYKFYDRFTDATEEIKRKFENTDMTKQVKLLKKSLQHMLALFITKQVSDYMEQIAVMHNQKNLDIKPHLYDTWLDCLVENVKDFDSKFDSDVELAWRLVMSPGIAFMKFQYGNS